MPKKICVMTSVHPPFDVRIFHKECQSLARAGYQVTLIAPIGDDRQCDGIFIRSFPNYRSRAERVLKGFGAMYRAARRERADIYHFHDPELMLVGLLLRVAGKKVVYDVHEDLPKTFTYKEYIPKWLRGPLQIAVRMIEGLAARFLSGVIAATTPIAERFTNVKHRAIVHNYPLLHEFTKKARRSDEPEGRDPYVVYVGARITSGRGAVEMVKAVGLLPSNMAIRLKLAGSFDPLELPSTLSLLPGWKRTDFVGVLGRAEVARLLHGALAGLVLLHPEPNYLNAQPVKLFEYMSAAIPAIASDFPVWRNIVESSSCGLLVDPLDPAAIASAIEYLWNHPDEAAEMGRRGRAAVENRYNWSREEQHLLAFYSDLAGTESSIASVHLGARA